MGNASRSFMFIVLFSIVFEAFAEERDIPWPLSWPLFQNATAPHRIIGGYGDWCIPDEGLHPGLDFTASDDDSVLLPTDSICFVIECIDIGSGYMLSLASNSSSDEGWYLGHLAVDNETIYPFNGDSVVMNHQVLAPCFDYSSPTDTVPLHLHLQWTDIPFYSTPPGYHNPFDYFENSLASYDEVMFGSVRWEDFLSPAANRGIWFTPDNYETYTQLGYAPGGPDQNAFQQVIYGAVDIAAAPYSAFQGISEEDSAGVYAVAYEILKQDPITGNYSSASQGQGNFGQRWLMEMRDELPPGSVPEYHAIFPDGLLPNGGGGLDSDWWYNMNAYIVTNSGALDTSSWQDGLSNVWTGPSDDDWTDGICRGAWNTALATYEASGGIPADAEQNSEAFFPDGRYAVAVTAVSHGSRATETDTLPVDDLSSNPSIDGIVVDNFQPYIEKIVVYAWNPTSQTCRLLYLGQWEDVNPQMLITYASEADHMHDTGFSRTASDNITGLQNGTCLLTDDHVNNGSLFLPSEVSAIEHRRELSGLFEPVETGISMDEEAEQERIRLHLAEIERNGGRSISVASDLSRYFFSYTYGFIYEPDEHLVLQVFYSEPTMTENMSGEAIADVVYSKYVIGSYSVFRTDFQRLPGGFQLPSVSNSSLPPDCYERSSTSLNSNNAVYYMHKQSQTEDYLGRLQLFFGSDYLADDQGPRDLAGNMIDSDPGTVSEPRMNYGPFSGTGFDTGPDMNHSWGIPHWDRMSMSDMVIGKVAADTVAIIDLASIGLEDGDFVGDCEYWCGFWMRSIPSWDENQFAIDIVLPPNGALRTYLHRTPYSWGMSSDKFCLFSDEALSTDTRYCWTTISTVNLESYISTVYAYCVDSFTGNILPAVELGTGKCWVQYDNPDVREVGQATALLDQNYIVYFSGSTFIDIDSTGVAEIEYSYFTDFHADSGAVDTVLVAPPAIDNHRNPIANDTAALNRTAATSQSTAEVRTNPTDDILTVDLLVDAECGYQLSVYDITGRQVLQHAGYAEAGSSCQIPVNHLPSGVYILRVTVEDKETVRRVSIIH